MTRTDYLRHPTGPTLYARPFQDGGWSSTGLITGDDSDESGKFVFLLLSDSVNYEVFLQAGGSPADGDRAVGILPVQITDSLISQVDSIATALNASQEAFIVPLVVKLADGSQARGVKVTVTTTNTSVSNDVLLEDHADQFGKVEFSLKEGTYYMWRSLRGHSFEDPQEFAVSDAGEVTVS